MHQLSNGFSSDPSEPWADTAVAIIGMSCRFAGARSVDQYWTNLCNGVVSIERYSDSDLIAAGVDPATLLDPHYVKAGAPLADMEFFDAPLFGLSARDAAIMDPQHRHLLECSWEALENAGHVGAGFKGAIGVFAGSGHNAYLARNLLTNPRLVRDVGMFLLRHTGNDKDFLSTRISYLLNLRGPSLNVQTACSTSLVAIHMAVQSLLNHECDMALAGAASIELPHRQGYLFEEGGILSPDGICRPFDARSEGTVFGSGAGVIVLRRLRDAIADGDFIHAVIRGSAVNNDGSSKVGYLAPSVDGHAQVITEALSIADVDAATVGYVETHGTGTPVGDPIEIAALSQAFSDNAAETGCCAIGSVKANIGHTDTAAGVAGIIKSALALRHAMLPPTVNFTDPNPSAGLGDSPFFVNRELLPWGRLNNLPLRAGVSSLGVGGTNAHVVLEEAPRRAQGSGSRPFQLLTLSARTTSALDANAAALGEHLAARPDVDLADAAYTLSVGRQPLGKRRAIVARNLDDAVAGLSKKGELSIATDVVADRPVAFMFCGAGSQYVGMGADLYDREPVYRDVIDTCAVYMKALAGFDIVPFLTATDGATEYELAIERPSIALPLLLAVQVATARLWWSWGIAPVSMIGHSAGEYAAAHLAGVMTLEDALHMMHARGRLFEKLPEGGMLSVPLAEAELRPFLPEGVSIAAINGPRLCIASGPNDALETLAEALSAAEIESQRVRISVAAHSSMLDALLPEFRDVIERVSLSPPRIAFVSSLTGDWIRPEEATNPEYWLRHMRETVRFADGVTRLFAEPAQLLLEVGPGRTMASLARQHPGRDKAQPVLNSLRHHGEAGNDQSVILHRLGQLWVSGVTVDWDRYWLGETRLRVPLPTYRFDRERHWFEPGTLISRMDEGDEPVRLSDLADWFYEPGWQRTPAVPSRPSRADALIFEDDVGVSEHIIQALCRAGRTAIRVRAGRHYKRAGDQFVIDPADAGHYTQMLGELAQAGRLPEEIFHLWQVTGAASQDVDRLQERGFYSLLHLAQALGVHELAPATEWAVISDGLQRVSGEPRLSPAKATLLGPCRVLRQEFPQMRVRSIDLPLQAWTPAALDRLSQALIAELSSPDDAEIIAYRSEERWTQTLLRARRAEPDLVTSALKQGGVYFITGGLGGIGLAVAQHLATHYSAKLALVGRTPLPPRDMWEIILSTRPAVDQDCRRIRAVQSIEAAGGQVLLLEGDVAKYTAMQRAVNAVRRHYGPIDGVFHAAGVLDDGPIALKTVARARTVIAPKLYGTLALERALAKERPGLFILFSSISAFAGLGGQVDYAAANAFLDAYAQSRRDDPATRVVSIGWSQWQEIGMAATSGAPPGPVPEFGAVGDAIALEHPLLDTLHILSDDHRIVEAVLSPESHWLLNEHRVADGTALIPGTGYLEIARAAFATCHDGLAELNDVVFLSPFAVADGTRRRMRVDLRRDSDTAWTFTLLGQPDGSSSEDWEEHVTGQIAPIPGDVPTACDPDRLIPACTAGEIPRAAIEAPPHLRFGRRWHVVERARLGHGEAVLHLRLHQDFKAEIATFFLHPALLDIATAGAQALIPGRDAERDFFAPSSYRQVSLYAPLTDRIVSHIRLRDGEQSDGSVASFDITVMDEDGGILVQIEAFTMLRISGSSRLGLEKVEAKRPASRAVPPASPTALRPHEGLELLERILDGPSSAHVIVCPSSVSHTVRHLRAPKRTGLPAGRSAEAQPDALPGTPMECLIAELWSEMLGVPEILRSDNFFDLGGHSLLAVQFTNRLRKGTGNNLPLSSFLENPVLERLAASLDPVNARADATASSGPDAEAIELDPPANNLVTIRRGGAKPPIFFIHDGLGETLLYRTLALQLDAGHPIYGLEPYRNPDRSFTHTRIDDMAAAYAARIQEIGSDGPYLLMGLCAGGVLAFETALLLRRQGKNVPYVGIMDAAEVGAAERPFYVTRSRIDRIALLLTESGGLKIVPTLGRRLANLVRWEVMSRIERRRQARAVDQMRQAGKGGIDLTGTGDTMAFLDLYEQAHAAHQPQGRFSNGDVSLYRATHGNGAPDDVPYCEIYSDHILGWGKRVGQEVSMLPVPGGHTSLLQEPHVRTLAYIVQRHINQAIRKWCPVTPRVGPDNRAARAEPVRANAEAELIG